MDTFHLKGFLKIAELGSISRAAVSLGLAQPSLSQQLLRLEDEVGFQLFHRTVRGVIITDAGRVFREHARQILLSTEQAIQDARHLKAEASGQVIFAMPSSISKLIGMVLVEALQDHAPQVKVRLVESFTGNIRGWLDSAKIDLGILYDQGPLRHLTARGLAREELYLIGPAGEFGSMDEPADVSLEALAKLPLIAAGPQHGLRQLLEREANRQGFEFTIVQEIDSIDVMTGLVSKGFGYAILPLPAVVAEADAGKISVARLGKGAIERSLSLVRNPSSVLTHASIRVEDITLKIMARLVDTGRWKAVIGPSKN